MFRKASPCSQYKFFQGRQHRESPKKKYAHLQTEAVPRNGDPLPPEIPLKIKIVGNRPFAFESVWVFEQLFGSFLQYGDKGEKFGGEDADGEGI